MASFAALLERFFYDPEEDAGALLDLPSAVIPVSEPASEEEADELLAFWLGDECYAIPIALVREVVRVPPLTEVPRGPANLVGVMNLRGEVLPVYDLKVRLNLASGPAAIAGPDGERDKLPRTARVLVLRLESGDAGVLIDRVSDVFRLKRSRIETPPTGISERDGVVGIGRRRDQLYILLDVEAALE